LARPRVDSRLQNIEKMEEKIESDIVEIKETVTKMKNGNNGNHNNTNSNTDSNINEEKIDCLCPETKKELNESGKE